jgi:hypothetical protein
LYVLGTKGSFKFQAMRPPSIHPTPPSILPRRAEIRCKMLSFVFCFAKKEGMVPKMKESKRRQAVCQFGCVKAELKEKSNSQARKEEREMLKY